jgi:hypothetical protein
MEDNEFSATEMRKLSDKNNNPYRIISKELEEIKKAAIGTSTSSGVYACTFSYLSVEQERTLSKLGYKVFQRYSNGTEYFSVEW